MSQFYLSLYVKRAIAEVMSVRPSVGISQVIEQNQLDIRVQRA